SVASHRPCPEPGARRKRTRPAVRLTLWAARRAPAEGLCTAPRAPVTGPLRTPRGGGGRLPGSRGIEAGAAGAVPAPAPGRPAGPRPPAGACAAPPAPGGLSFPPEGGPTRTRATCRAGARAAALGGGLGGPAGAGAPPKSGPPGPADKGRPAAPPGTAVPPKPLSDAVKKGLEYLAGQQDASGGWGQGGGWRADDKGGRVEGAQVKDPPDVGNTCVALLALVRAGNTPTEGPYAKNVARAAEFVCARVEKADDKSLDIADVKGTQLQGKIGPYVDTFL